MEHVYNFEKFSINEKIKLSKSIQNALSFIIQDIKSTYLNLVNCRIDHNSLTVVFKDAGTKELFINNLKKHQELWSSITEDKAVYINLYDDDADNLYVYVDLKDMYSYKVKPPRLVFHITDTHLRNSIFESGLIPRSNTEYGINGYQKPCLFVTKNKHQLFTGFRENYDVYVIDTHMCQNIWYRDFNYPDDKDYLFTTSPIAPRCFKVLSKDAFEYKYF